MPRGTAKRAARATTRRKPKRNAPITAFIDWINPNDGKCVRIRITHTRQYFNGSDHVEVQTIRPPRAPLPITETGYKSHFLTPDELEAAGGLVKFVETELATAARSKEWLKQDLAHRQGNLFAWAEAHQAVTTKRKSPARRKPKRRIGHRPAPEDKG